MTVWDSFRNISECQTSSSVQARGGVGELTSASTEAGFIAGRTICCGMCRTCLVETHRMKNSECTRIGRWDSVDFHADRRQEVQWQGGLRVNPKMLKDWIAWATEKASDQKNDGCSCQEQRFRRFTEQLGGHKLEWNEVTGRGSAIRSPNRVCKE